MNAIPSPSSSPRRPPHRELPPEFPGAARYAEEELEAVARVVRNRSPFRYYGPRFGGEVRELEQEFARFLASAPGQPWPESSPFQVTAVNSGTGALEVALDALGVGEGDEVLVQGFMWISSISAIVRQRAIPVLVDSDDTLNMDPAEIRRRVGPRTRVVMPVPMLGGCARIGALMATVRELNIERAREGLPVIRVLEDCAQSMGAHAFGTPGSVTPTAPEGIHRVGTFGDAAIFSLQINKNITAGEGGLVVSRDPGIARRIEALHNAGYARDGETPTNWYGDTPIGWGHGRRLGEIQGALARVQLRRLDPLLEAMRSSHDRIEAHLRSLGLATRARADATHPGDTGYYCQFHLPERGDGDEARLRRGRAVAAALGEFGLRPWFLHDFEVHVYYNIEPLVGRWPLNGGGPWPEATGAQDSRYGYDRGTLPHLDRWLTSTVGINIPSVLTPEDEAYIRAALSWVVSTTVGA
ncbi:MAG: DegT/DnrJ/EryC1/StrS family aminotransferase [Verrucomicrobiota bacterium]